MEACLYDNAHKVKMSLEIEHQHFCTVSLCSPIHSGKLYSDDFNISLLFCSSPKLNYFQRFFHVHYPRNYLYTTVQKAVIQIHFLKGFYEEIAHIYHGCHDASNRMITNAYFYNTLWPNYELKYSQKLTEAY
jgi:hypothetical protein